MGHDRKAYWWWKAPLPDGPLSQGEADTLPPDQPERDSQAYRMWGNVTVEFVDDGAEEGKGSLG